MVGDAVRGAARDVTFRATAPVNLDRVSKRVHPIENQASFSVEKPSAREQRLALAADLVPPALLAAVLWFLRGVARSVRDGDPFSVLLGGLGVFILAQAFAHGCACATTSPRRSDMPPESSGDRIGVHLDR